MDDFFLNLVDVPKLTNDKTKQKLPLEKKSDEQHSQQKPQQPQRIAEKPQQRVNISNVKTFKKEPRIFKRPEEEVNESKSNKEADKANVMKTTVKVEPADVQNSEKNIFPSTKSSPLNDTKFDKRPITMKSTFNRQLPNGSENWKPAKEGVANQLKSCDIKLIVNDEVGSESMPVFSKSTYSQLNLFDEKLVSCLSQRLSVTKVTAIQKLAIPTILAGKDCLIKAQTGSGKTLAYCIPIVHMIQQIQPEVHRESGLLALILTPTRELCTQTNEVVCTITQPFVRIVVGCLTGGVRMKAQKASIRKGLNIIVATPQRILEHIHHTNTLDLSHLNWLVVDEADRMLEMGYMKDVAEIIDQIYNQRKKVYQSILLSATLTAEVEKLACLTLRDPVRCIVNSHLVAKPLVDGEPTTTTTTTTDADVDTVDLPAGLKHFVLISAVKLRLVTLSTLLLSCQFATAKSGKIIVFFSTQDSVNFHYELFKEILQTKQFIPKGMKEAIQFFRLHGKIDHESRQKTFQDFKESRSGVLLTTDVASRGLDISCVSWVIQYNPPVSAVDYIHRVGRTARAGGHGKAVIILNPDESEFSTHLQTKLSSAGLRLRQLHLVNLLKNSQKLHIYPLFAATVEEMCAKLQKRFETIVEKDNELKSLAEKAFTSVVRSYATFSKEMREYFNFTQLHLGHLTKSYALRETPSEVSAKLKKKRKHQNEDGDEDGMDNKLMKRSNSNMQQQIWQQKKTDHAKRNMLAEYGVW